MIWIGASFCRLRSATGLGFKSLLERNLTEELQKYGLYPVMFGKDATESLRCSCATSGPGPFTDFTSFSRR